MKSVESLAKELKESGLEKTIWMTPAEEIEDADLRRLWELAQITMLKIYKRLERLGA